MTLVRKLFVIAVYGYFCHFTYLFTSRLSVGYSQMAAYTLGVLFVLPAAVWVHDDLEEIEDPAKRFVAGYLLTFLGFGAGTGVGWQLHPMDGPHTPMLDDKGIR